MYLLNQKQLKKNLYKIIIPKFQIYLDLRRNTWAEQ